MENLEWTPHANTRLIITDTGPIVGVSFTVPAKGEREINYGPWGASQYCFRQLVIKDAHGAVLYANTPQVCGALKVVVGPTQSFRGQVSAFGLSPNTTYTLEFNAINPDHKTLSYVPGAGPIDFYIDLNNLGD